MKKPKPKAKKSDASTVAELLKQVQDLLFEQKIIKEELKALNSLLRALTG